MASVEHLAVDLLQEESPHLVGHRPVPFVDVEELRAQASDEQGHLVHTERASVRALRAVTPGANRGLGRVRESHQVAVRACRSRRREDGTDILLRTLGIDDEDEFSLGEAEGLPRNLGELLRLKFRTELLGRLRADLAEHMMDELVLDQVRAHGDALHPAEVPQAHDGEPLQAFLQRARSRTDPIRGHPQPQRSAWYNGYLGLVELGSARGRARPPEVLGEGTQSPLLVADWLTGTSGIEWLQGLGSPPVDLAMQALTQLGAWPLLAAVALVLYWIDGRREGLWLAWLLVATMFATDLLKLAFGADRPLEALWKASASGFGLPSGHSSAAAAFWPALLLRPARLGRAIVAGLLIALVALSRVYLGVHFPLDAFGGVLLGLGLFGIWWLLRSRKAFWLRSELLPFGAGALVIGLFLLSVAIAPANALPAFYPLGLGLGLLVGATLGGFRPASQRLTVQVRTMGVSALFALAGVPVYLLLRSEGDMAFLAAFVAIAFALGAPPYLPRRLTGLPGPQPTP